MAQRVITLLEDDIDGGEADETVRFGLDGTNYEIDLSEKNATKLRDALSAYVGAARKVTGTRGRSTAARPSAGHSSGSGYDAKVVREWAKEKGLEVPDRGRIPAAVLSAWEAR